MLQPSTDLRPPTSSRAQPCATGSPVHESEGPWTRRRAGFALAAITLFALVVRLVGIGFQLPHEWEPDQRVYTTQVTLLRQGDPNPELDVNFGWYPLLPATIVASLPHGDAGPPPSNLEEHLAAASALRLEIRRVLATLSILVVPATYWIARRFGRRETALLAALIAAASIFHVWFAQQTRPHGLTTATTALGLVGALIVRRRGDAFAYLAAGALLGLAVSVLQSGLAVLPAILAAHVLCTRGNFWRRSMWLAAGLALTCVAVRLAYPFVFMVSAGSGKDAAQFGLEEQRFNLSGHSVDLGLLGPGGFRVMAEAWCDYDPGILALATLGILALGWATWRGVRSSSALGVWRALARDHADLLVVLSFALPYALVFGFYERTYPRFSLPFLPLLAVVAAKYALDPATPRWIRRGALALCVVQMALVVRLAAIRAEPSTAQLAAKWLIANADREHDRVMLQSGIDVPLLRDEKSRKDARLYVGSDARPWLLYQTEAARKGPLEPAWSMTNFAILRASSRELLKNDPGAWVRSLDTDWFVIARGISGRSLELDGAGRAIAANCELAARFTPLAFGLGEDTPFLYQNDIQVDKSSLWLHLPIALRMGAVIEVWRAPPTENETVDALGSR